MEQEDVTLTYRRCVWTCWNAFNTSTRPRLIMQAMMFV